VKAAPGATLSVRVTPRGGRDALDGWTTDASGRALLKLRVSAAAADGAANAAVLALLADSLHLPRSRLRIVRGETARVKQIAVEGLDEQALRARLQPPA
jgi:uncharacterized protein YggU (UPF0235/DUF167 family)